MVSNPLVLSADLSIFSQTNAQQLPQLMRLLKLICEVFLSLCAQDIPAYVQVRSTEQILPGLLYLPVACVGFRRCSEVGHRSAHSQTLLPCVFCCSC
jgi:hypothetical protein